MWFILSHIISQWADKSHRKNNTCWYCTDHNILTTFCMTTKDVTFLHSHYKTLV